MAKSTTPENVVVKDCLTVLTLARWKAWRANTGAAWLPGKHGKNRPVFFGPKGQSDILAIVPRSGRLLAIECKVAPNKPSEDQRAFMQNVSDSGGVAIVAYSAVDLLKVVQQLTSDPWLGARP